jgi:GNAT superfamily N-acetyltransferase
MLENISYFSTEKCSITPVIPMDQDSLIQESAVLFKEWSESRGRNAPIDEYIEELDACISDGGIVILAQKANVSVGFRHAIKWFKDHLYLADAYVVPDFRRQGLYGTIVDLTEQIARKNGFKSISSHTLESGEALRVLLRKEYQQIPKTDVRHLALGNVFKQL